MVKYVTIGYQMVVDSFTRFSLLFIIPWVFTNPSFHSGFEALLIILSCQLCLYFPTIYQTIFQIFSLSSMVHSCFLPFCLLFQSLSSFHYFHICSCVCLYCSQQQLRGTFCIFSLFPYIEGFHHFFKIFSWFLLLSAK